MDEGGCKRNVTDASAPDVNVITVYITVLDDYRTAAATLEKAMEEIG